ncbi:MAG TPA: DMT family transporter [Terriglobales bacterium]|nr:DMT family transporter [Terriglobales bacterium]
MSVGPLASVLLSAALFGVSVPLSKLLLGGMQPVALAGILYLGSFVGLSVYSLALRALRGQPITAIRGASPAGQFPPGGAVPPNKGRREAKLERKDWPWLAGAIVTGGIVGPVCLLAGLGRISGFSASLFLNFEGVATAAIAVVLFGENAGRRLWLALALMTAAGVALSWNAGNGRFSLAGPVLVVLAMLGWGLDNNLTRRISDKDPVAIARVKGLAAGAVSTAAAFLLGQGARPDGAAAKGLAVGAVCYGLSLVLFIRGLKGLGAFRAGAFFSLAPFVGALASLRLLGDTLRWPMAAAGLLMAAGVALIVTERHTHVHRHERTAHAHSHSHDDGHHGHAHEGAVEEPHSHEHVHEETEHAHGHWPDTHHRHGH